MIANLAVAATSSARLLTEIEINEKTILSFLTRRLFRSLCALHTACAARLCSPPPNGGVRAYAARVWLFFASAQIRQTSLWEILGTHLAIYRGVNLVFKVR